MQNKKTITILYFLLILLILSACSLARQDDPIIPATSHITITEQTSQLPVSTSEVARPSHTPTLSPEARCPKPNKTASILMHEARTRDETEQLILDYLNQGGSPEQLQNEMNNLGSVITSHQVLSIDINTDDVQEIVSAINFAPPAGGDWLQAQTNLSIYYCVDGEYQVQKVTEGGSEELEIIAMTNLIDSEAPELLIKRVWFYRTGCDEFVEMFSLKPKGWFSSLKSDEFLCNIKVEFINDNNSSQKLAIEGRRGCSYMACGPSRDRKITYSFVDGKIELTNDELLPSPYRIHALEDGEIAIENGDLDVAIQNYDKAAKDSNLINLLTEMEKEMQVSQNISDAEIRAVAQDYQSSFALFRELVLLLYLRQDDEASKILEELKALYPENKHGGEFVDISNYLIEQVESSLSVKEACELTNEYIANKYILGENDFIYQHLNGWGDMTPQIGEILCPVIEP